MKSFDERAKDWDADPAKVRRASVTADLIRQTGRVNPGMTALEYGCGTGLLSFALQEDFQSITLVDTSQGMLDVLKQKIQAAEVHNMHPWLVNTDFQPAPEGGLDVIFSLLALHHTQDVDFVLRQFRGLLKTGGTLFIADLDKEDGSFHGPEVTDVHKGFEHAALRAQLESARFEKVQYVPAFEIKKQVSGQEKSFPVFLAYGIAK